MLPSNIQSKNDLELVKLVQDHSSSEAITEIINRHTGIYLNVVKNFQLPPIVKTDFVESKDTKIYDYVMKYDGTRGSKLSSYIHRRTKWDCLGVKKDEYQTGEIDDNEVGESHTFNDEESVKNLTLQIARDVGGFEFSRVVEARFFGADPKTSWHKLNVGKSYEWARSVFMSHEEEFKKRIAEKFEYFGSYGKF